MVSRLLALCTLLAAAPVAALQGPFAEDGELGSLERWSEVFAAGPNTVAPSPLAAHRGVAGVRVVDAQGAADLREGEQVRLGLDLAVSSGAFYVRYWTRLVEVKSLGRVDLVELTATAGGQPWQTLAFRAPIPGATPDSIAFVGWTGPAPFAYLQDVHSPGLAVGQWHLVELALEGVGDASAVRRAWLDGVEVLHRSINLEGFKLTRLNLGEPYGVVGFTGTVDYDDIRAGPVPHASRLALDATAASSDCVPMTVALKDSSNAPAAAPYAVEVSLSASSARFFADDACGTERATVEIRPGETSAKFFARVDKGAEVVAEHPDLLPATLTVSEGGRSYYVWGCGSVPALSPACLLALFALRRRRKSMSNPDAVTSKFSISKTPTADRSEFTKL